MVALREHPPDLRAGLEKWGHLRGRPLEGWSFPEWVPFAYGLPGTRGPVSLGLSPLPGWKGTQVSGDRSPTPGCRQQWVGVGAWLPPGKDAQGRGANRERAEPTTEYREEQGEAPRTRRAPSLPPAAPHVPWARRGAEPTHRVSGSRCCQQDLRLENPPAISRTPKAGEGSAGATLGIHSSAAPGLAQELSGVSAGPCSRRAHSRGLRHSQRRVKAPSHSAGPC